METLSNNFVCVQRVLTLHANLIPDLLDLIFFSSFHVHSPGQEIKNVSVTVQKKTSFTLSYRSSFEDICLEPGREQKESKQR